MFLLLLILKYSLFKNYTFKKSQCINFEKKLKEQVFAIYYINKHICKYINYKKNDIINLVYDGINNFFLY